MLLFVHWRRQVWYPAHLKKTNLFYLFLYKIASLLHQRCVASAAVFFVCRPGGDRGGGVDSPAAGAAEPGCRQDLFRQGATRPAGKLLLVFILASLQPSAFCSPRLHLLSSDRSDLQSVPAAAEWQTPADRFHGNRRQQAPDAALAHRLPSGILKHKRLKRWNYVKNGCLPKA